MPRQSEVLTAAEREALRRLARSRQAPHAVAVRAKLVLDRADLSAAEAARRAGVTPTTAAKWWRRYQSDGIEGLEDVPRPGRPPATAEVVRAVLVAPLDEPPEGTDRWTTRAIAERVGASQATVSRVRNRYFPRPESDAPLWGLSRAILTYVDVQPDGCALGFQPVGEAPAARGRAPRLDVVETILAARLMTGPGVETGGGPGAGPALSRALAALPPAGEVTLVLDRELDVRDRQWLAQHPEVTVQSAPGPSWYALLHRVAAAVDPRQLSELREVQQLIRAARREGADGFRWSHVRDTRPSAPQRALGGGPGAPLVPELAAVVRGMCQAIRDGELSAGDAIAPRRIATLTELSPGRVAEALAHLAEDALVERRAGQFLLPAPTARDVIETYTARGLLGTALVRRLASSSTGLPPAVDEHLATLVRYDRLGLVREASDLDLDLQDEVASVAGMPRIGAMFLRLSLQLRLFTTLFGLSWRYPTDEIVRDDGRIVQSIRRQDPDAAVEAWRRKIDNCADYMLTQLRPKA